MAMTDKLRFKEWQDVNQQRTLEFKSLRVPHYVSANDDASPITTEETLEPQQLEQLKTQDLS